MKLYDISRELFSTPVYPGDPTPSFERVRRMELGDMCNLTGFYTGCHSATHVDAPLHFVADGASIDQVPLDAFFGPCRVITVSGILTGAEVDALALQKGERVLLRGGAFLSQSAAFAFGEAGVALIGTDQQSIGSAGDEQAPHVELLSRGIPLLEGLILDDVPDGEYFLCAQPFKLAGLEASPVRAVLFCE